jgi:ribosomal protein S27E
MVSQFTRSLRTHLGLPIEEDREQVIEKSGNLFDYFRAGSLAPPTATTEPQQKCSSSLAQHLRSAMLAQSEYYEISCVACNYPNTVRLHPTQIVAGDFCHRCGTTLLLSANQEMEKGIRPSKRCSR